MESSALPIIASKKEHSLTYAIVCASNQNRSMSAHAALNELGLSVKSYGTGSSVRLPGPSIDAPNVYDFGTPYEKMQADLFTKDEKLYTANGLLAMLERNKKIKLAPERWQARDFSIHFDVIITCEERVFAAVYEDLTLANPLHQDHLSHLINIEIKDNHEAAAIGAKVMTYLASQLETASDVHASMETILDDFSKTYPNHSILYSVCFN